jgi:glucose-6-phosphate isomerase/transaldolase/glucose-6-phosphate isomerase
MIRAIPEPRGWTSRIEHLATADAVRRAWSGDYTLWGSQPAEIANRLGWLRLPQTMSEHVGPLRHFADSVRSEGCDAVALLGMGGSSLAPETLARTLRSPAGAPRLIVLDTTHPDALRRLGEPLDARRTLFIVSTKSGTTSETLSLFHHFYRLTRDAVGDAAAGGRFVAITDPGSPLVQLAQQHNFRRVFLNDPTIGGRYAALSLVGLVPAALLGLDLDELIESARSMTARCGPSIPLERNPAALLAALLAAHVDDGHDKATIVLPKALASFGDWLEQLIAESTGKCGMGVVPIVGEPLGTPDVYGADRVFIRLGTDAETPHPTVDVEFPGPEDIGGQFFLWEFATALLGHLLGVNPFDQPDVESSKKVTRQMLSAYREQGERPSAPCVPLTPDTLRQFVSQAVPGDYIAILAYLDPRPEIAESLATLRRALRDATHCATTLGYGPRFLHSTGQLHKGDSGRGLFIELVDEVSDDLQIPDGSGRPVSFGLLLRAQAFGDAQALAARGRRVLVTDLGRNAPAMLRDAAAAI